MERYLQMLNNLGLGMNMAPLSDIVNAYIKDTVNKLNLGDDEIERACLNALMATVYMSDDNKIKTVKQLAYRVNCDYSSYYLPYLAEITDDEEELGAFATRLDIAVRAQLTVLGLLYCIDCNQFKELPEFIKETRVVINEDKKYTGCMIICKNGFIMDTVRQVISLGFQDTGLIPGIIKTAFDACIGFPHFNGTWNKPTPMPEIIREPSLEELNEQCADLKKEYKKYGD